MNWPELVGAAYAVLLESLGEPVETRTSDGANTATLRGVYDRRAFRDEINGTPVISADYRIGVLEAELPGWVQPAIDSVGVEADVRTDALRVNAIHADGQGVAALMCRSR